MQSETWRRTHEWGALTRAEIAQARDAGALVVLPTGAIEQHADHLPVDTDSLSAWRVAKMAAERCASPHALLLPTPAFGFSPHHGAWAGTVSLSLSTFTGVIADIADEPAADRVLAAADRQRSRRQSGAAGRRLHGDREPGLRRRLRELLSTGHGGVVSGAAGCAAPRRPCLRVRDRDAACAAAGR